MHARQACPIPDFSATPAEPPQFPPYSTLSPFPRTSNHSTNLSSRKSKFEKLSLFFWISYQTVSSYPCRLNHSPTCQNLASSRLHLYYLVVQFLCSSRAASRVQVIVALHRPALDRLLWPKSMLSSFHKHATPRRCQPSAYASPCLPHAAVVRARYTRIIVAHTRSHWASVTVAALHAPAGHRDGKLPRHEWIEPRRSCGVWHGHSVVEEWHTVQAEVAWCACRHVVVDGEMTIATSIVASLGESGRIKHIAIDQLNLGSSQYLARSLSRDRSTYVFLELLEPVRMPLLHMLLPKVLALEQLCALGHLASELELVLLFHELAHVFL